MGAGAVMVTGMAGRSCGFTWCSSGVAVRDLKFIYICIIINLHQLDESE